MRRHILFSDSGHSPEGRQCPLAEALKFGVAFRGEVEVWLIEEILNLYRHLLEALYQLGDGHKSNVLTARDLSNRPIRLY